MIVKLTYSLFFIVMTISCKKYVTVDQVEGRFLIPEVFSSDAVANTAVAGVYRKWRDLYISPASPTILCGLSADELHSPPEGGDYIEYFNNGIGSRNSILPWANLYNIIYQTNLFIESLQRSKDISLLKKNYYLGEVKFIRAHCYFNLVNLFGNVPLLLSTNIDSNAVAKRDTTINVYKQIITDIRDAEILMQDEIFHQNEKERLNMYVARAFLARVYLYLQKWDEAVALSDSIINSGKYSLSEDLNQIFQKGSSESIFQFSDNASDGNFELQALYAGKLALTNSLLNAFEVNDKRTTSWMDTVSFPDGNFIMASKYKSFNVGDNELYTLFRLAEVYLIRAEAYVGSGNVTNAVNDINLLRVRAGLPELQAELTEEACLDAIIQERRVELFAETGHRWVDLKRTRKLKSVMAAEKGDLWMDSDSLYPLPEIDIQRNPNLYQNSGYK